MNPALSVIFFTAVSGTGYGLLFLLSLSLVTDPRVFSRTEALVVLATGSVFTAAGLTSSLFHLGQPQRAWRALSQWRSSWLSREGVAALLSFTPGLALGLALWRDADASSLRACASVLAVMAAITVCCTAKIYTSLKTVHAWNNAYVLPGYLLFGLLGGTVWLWLLSVVGDPTGWLPQLGLPALVALFAAACAVHKRGYWRFIDTTRHAATAESATGLGHFGTVRSVDAPHTEENYLTREMGFVLARKHAATLRVTALVLIAILPVALALAALIFRSTTLVIFYASVTALCVTTGIFVERWLFFAEARHVVMLYYRSELA